MDRNRNLLLVEDDETTRELLTILLANAGWTVTATESGEAAQAHLAGLINQRGARPAVALCDQNLPGIQGSELASALQAICPGLTLIAMSGTPLPGTPEGYSAFLTKPFPVTAFDSALHVQVPASRAAPGHGAQVLDPVIVAQLKQTMGDRARPLFEFALADAGERLETMRIVADGVHGPAAFRREAHALKGSAGMIGAEKLAALAAAAESADTVSEASTLRQQVDEMELACGEIHRMLDSLFPAD